MYKYGDPTLSISATEVWEHHRSSQEAFRPNNKAIQRQFSNAYLNAVDHMDMIKGAKVNVFKVVEDLSISKFILWVAGMVLIVLLLFWRIGWMLMFRTIILMFILGVIIAILSAFFQGFFRALNVHEDVIILILFLSIWSNLIRTGLKTPNSARDSLWNIMKLTAACSIAPLIPFAALILYDMTIAPVNTDPHPLIVTFILTSGILGTLGAMPYLFLKKIDQFKAYPPSK